MKIPNQLSALGAQVLERGHRALLAISGGRFPKSVLGMEPIELHHLGRSSGKRRSTLLTAPVFDEDRIVLVASKGGHDEHPDWYKNLRANPAVEITACGRTRPMVAHTASAAEKAELWPSIVQAYSGYASYQRNTARDIPVVICTPDESRRDVAPS
ncbi:MAG: nitroreductase family deazaflavin-dependent oxidoreductase [Actinobacteria bacterium]|nr:nitroreductase family deazaflavin-dependent oxidoreductase [Actinomycetota bacterium]